MKQPVAGDARVTDANHKMCVGEARKEIVRPAEVGIGFAEGTVGDGVAKGDDR